MKGSLKGFRKGFRRVLEGVSRGPCENPLKNLRKPFQKPHSEALLGSGGSAAGNESLDTKTPKHLFYCVLVQSAQGG